MGCFKSLDSPDTQCQLHSTIKTHYIHFNNIQKAKKSETNSHLTSVKSFPTQDTSSQDPSTAQNTRNTFKFNRTLPQHVLDRTEQKTRLALEFQDADTFVTKRPTSSVDRSASFNCFDLIQDIKTRKHNKTTSLKQLPTTLFDLVEIRAEIAFVT